MSKVIEKSIEFALHEWIEFFREDFSDEDWRILCDEARITGFSDKNPTSIRLRFNEVNYLVEEEDE